MPRPATRSLLVVLLAGTLLAGATGCGTSEQEARQERRQAAEARRLREKAARIEEEIQQLKAQQAQLAPGSTTTTGPTTQGAAGPKGPTRNCGGGVAAGRGTTCAFALNTAQEWVDTSGGTTIQVYSPATKKTYTMNCTTGSQGTTCKGGNGAVVYIP